MNPAKATDLLDERYGLGEPLGGMILLSVCPGAMRRSAEGRRLVPYQAESHPSGPLTDDPFSPTSYQLAAVLGRLRHHGRQGTASPLRAVACGGG